MNGDSDFTYKLEDERECQIIHGRLRREIRAVPQQKPVSPAAHSRIIAQGFDKDPRLSAYFKMACETCRACQPCRIVAKRHEPSRNDKRILKRNNDLVVAVNPRPFLLDHRELYLRNFDARHAAHYSPGQRVMIQMAPQVHQLLEGTMIKHHVLEARRRDNNELLAALIFDECDNALNASYYYFEPHGTNPRSLGTFIILKLIEEAQARDKDYIYHGALTTEPSKLSYKSRFQPVEILNRRGEWVPYETPAPL